MRRFLLTSGSKLVADSFSGLRAPEIARKKVSGLVEALRSFGTSTGYQRAQSLSRSLQEEIVDALHLGERNRAFHLLSELGSGNQSLVAEDFILILQCCAKMPDPLFVMQTWKFMVEKDVEFSGKCYLFTIRALCKGGYLNEAFNILSFLRENSDETAMLSVYNNLLEACVQTHNLNDANKCLHLMEQQMAGKNEITYAILLKLAVFHQDLAAVYEIWKECIKCYSLSVITLQKFIWSFTKLKDLNSAYAALQQMVIVAFQRDFHVTKTAKGIMRNSRLDIPISSRDKLTLNRHDNENYNFLSSAPEYFMVNDSSKREHLAKICFDAEEFRDWERSFSQWPFSIPVMELLSRSFTDVIHTCASTKNVVLAEKLMSQMQYLGLEPSCRTYDGFIKAQISVKGYPDGVEALKVMRQKNMKPRDSTLVALSVGCSKELELDLAEIFMDQISQCSHAYPYNAFLEACDMLDQPESALRVFTKMRRLNILPDIRTYELLFSLFGNVNAPYEDGNMLSQVDASKRINAIEMDMIRHSIKHSHRSLENLLKALGREGMMKELIQYLHAAESQFFNERTILGIPIYNTVLHSLVEAKESDIAIEIFRGMMLSGFPRNAATYNIMIDCCSTIKCYRSACALVSLMIRDGFCLHSVTYTTLIKVLLKSEDFGGALKLLDQGTSDGIQPDVLLYNTILLQASYKGRIDVIELIVERMHQEKIQPDPLTCSHVFSSYVDHGFQSTAMEALQVLSLRMISLQDDILEEHRIEYENLIFHEDSEAETHIIEIFKDSTHLAVALLHLRWCAICGYPISWLPNQNPWAKRLSSDYANRHPG